MIKETDQLPAPPRPRRGAAAVSPRAARALVLLAAFVCAACGLVYELDLVALGSYLLGDSVTQASLVLSVMVCAMGVGSLLAKHLTARPATSFAVIEGALALLGGLSVFALYGCFVWLGHYRLALVGFAGGIGVLIGAEIPLLMTLVQRVRAQDAGSAAADLFAADYIGALIGGLAFPFVLLPVLGQLGGALVTGLVNAAAGASVVLWLFREESGRRARMLLWIGCGGVLLALLVAWAMAGAFERAARQSLYGAPVRVAAQGRVHEIVLTAPAADTRLYLDGRLTACTAGARGYATALVAPGLDGRSARPGRGLRVLVLGGGDGLAAAEALRSTAVARVTVVEQDPVLLRLARTDPGLRALNGGALDDPRVDTATDDPFAWLRTAPRRHRRYDLVVADLPDPGQDQNRKYYSQEFYGLVARMLAPGARLVVHAGSTGTTAYGDAAATLASLGLPTLDYTTPTTCPGPTDWAFVLAQLPPAPSLDTTPHLPPTAHPLPTPPPGHTTTLLHPN